MTRRLRSLAVLTAVFAASMAAACGSNASFSPSSPSAISGGSLSATTGAIITGNVNGAPTGLTTQSLGVKASSRLIVSVVGTNLATPLDAGGRFTLTGVPNGNVQLNFSGSGVDATVAISGVASDSRIDLTVSVNGKDAKIEHERHEHADHRLEIEGRVTAVDSAARTITVDDKKIDVPATAIIRHGSTTLTFADLKVGTHVEIKGTQDGTKIIASEVKVEVDGDDADDDDHGDEHEATEVKGVVSGLTGSCTAGLSFTVGTTKVTTNTSTRFEGGACAAVQNTVKVEVKGTKQTDGSLAAAVVEIDD